MPVMEALDRGEPLKAVSLLANMSMGYHTFHDVEISLPAGLAGDLIPCHLHLAPPDLCACLIAPHRRSPDNSSFSIGAVAFIVHNDPASKRQTLTV